MYWYPIPPWLIYYYYYYYGVPVYPPTPYYLPPVDPAYLTALMTQYIVYPYYYMVTLEAYRKIFETWSRVMESFIKSLGEKTTQ
jgi:hypothetical protein